MQVEAGGCAHFPLVHPGPLGYLASEACPARFGCGRGGRNGVLDRQTLTGRGPLARES